MAEGGRNNRHRLIGGQSGENVAQFIKEGLASDEVDNNSDKTFFDEDFDFFDSRYMNFPEESAKSPDTQSG